MKHNANISLLKTNDSLSIMLKEGTKSLHREVERGPLIQAIFKGGLTKSAYIDFMAALNLVYIGMEKGLEEHRNHPIIGQFYFPELFRASAISQDLDFLTGSQDWASKKILPAARYYQARLSNIIDNNPHLLMAHIYTRYLGDLSGGQIMVKMVSRELNLTTKEGLSFYQFDQINNIQLFKDEFRQRMDSLPLDYQMRLDVVKETQEAFRLNGLIADSVAQQHAIAA